MNKPNNPRVFTTEIKSTSETAFQRALWLCKTSIIEGEAISWIDIELPVDISGNARGKCIDLIGKDESGNFVICELKFGEPGNGNPHDAQRQLAEYFEQITKNSDFLGQHINARERGNINWHDVASNTTRFILAANEAYWQYWLNQRNLTLPSDVECYELPIPTDYFKLLDKDKNGQYTPSIPAEKNIWKRLGSSK